MSSLINGAKNTIKIMFDRAHEVLRQHGIKDRFWVQICAYRNYNSKEDELLEKSQWETKHDNLKIFLDGITAKAGSSWGEEAIEIALNHVNWME